MLYETEKASSDFYALLSATEWADPETQTFKEFLWSLSERHSDTHEIELMPKREAAEHFRCVERFRGSFAHELDLPIAA